MLYVSGAAAIKGLHQKANEQQEKEKLAGCNVGKGSEKRMVRTFAGNLGIRCESY